MTPERFWRCVPCEAVIRLSAQDAGAGTNVLGPLWFAVAQQERAAFFEAHRTHLIELLTQTLPVVANTGPLWDPQTILRWEVSNASRRFVIEGKRTSPEAARATPTLDDPLQYTCLLGCLRSSVVGVEVPTEEISRLIDEALFPHVLPHGRLRKLTDAASSALLRLRADELEVLQDSPTNPMLGIARIPTKALEDLFSSVGYFLADWERPRIAAKLTAAHASDELLITVTRQYDVQLEP